MLAAIQKGVGELLSLWVGGMFTISGTWRSVIIAEHCGLLSLFVGGVVGHHGCWWSAVIGVGGGLLLVLVVGHRWCWCWPSLALFGGGGRSLPPVSPGVAASNCRCMCSHHHAIVAYSSSVLTVRLLFPIIVVRLLFPIIVVQLLSSVVICHR